jgi:hypothetical protein
MDDVVPMSLARINKNLTVVSSMFKWARRFGFVCDNPAEGLQVRIQHKASDERKAYDKDDLMSTQSFTSGAILANSHFGGIVQFVAE